MKPVHNDDVIKWKQFTRYWPFVRGIHRAPENPPHKSQWRAALMYYFICSWINGWVSNREARGLRGLEPPTAGFIPIALLLDLQGQVFAIAFWASDTHTHTYIYIHICIVYMWQKTSVSSHESAQRNVTGHLKDENVFTTTRSFRYHWFCVSTLQANANKPSSFKHKTHYWRRPSWNCNFKMAAASSEYRTNIKLAAILRYH